MTRSGSTLRALLAIVSFAAALSCGGDASDATRTQRQAVTGTWTLSCPIPPSVTGFGAFLLPPAVAGLPFTPITSLAGVANPVLGGGPAPALRADLATYVADLNTAIVLGKALFWDIQASSDNKVACATCHFQAGADPRLKNQLNPGANNLWDGKSTNYTVVAADFPFTDPALGTDVDNVVGSQGVRALTYGGLTAANAEITTPVNDPIFGTMRQVTGKNTPSVVNAVFNHRNFHNGRAQPEFNGVNPFGSRDATALVWQINAAGKLVQVAIQIGTASLASQAVGPPLNTVEMSATGRTFPELGKKLTGLKPLALQAVSPTDSVLGPFAAKNGGLSSAYTALIQKAFQPAWWSYNKNVTVNGKPYTMMQANFSLFWGLSIMLYESTLVANDSPMDRYAASRTIDRLTGLVTADNPALLDAVVNRLAAEGTTIPLATGGSRAVTRDDILLGLDLFERPLPLPGTAGIPAGNRYLGPAPSGVGCGFCHVGAETTAASIRNVTVGVEVDAAKNQGLDLRMERMFMGVRTPAPTPPQPPPPVPFLSDVIVYDSANYTVNVIDINNTPVTAQPMKINSYDVGWYNVGIRPTADDAGVGGLDPFGNPLSWVGYYQKTLADPFVIKIPTGGGLGCVDANNNPIVPPAAPLTSPFAGEVIDPGLSGYPILTGGLSKTEASDSAGSFKTLQLRNVELNGPYFHSGGKATLTQAVELYDAGGNFANATLPPLIRPLGLTPDQSAALVAFMVALTDDRVRYERAPFDHPALPVPAGQDALGNDLVTILPAVGSAGSATPLARFLGLNPFQP